MQQNYTLKIIDIIDETKDTKTICFKQPLLKKIKYKAGQYLTISVRINGRKYARPYSFSSSPSVDKDIRITVKKIPNGRVSNYVFEHFKIGDSVEVLEPTGDFVLPKSITSLCFWGVGSGITPLFSMIKEIVNLNQNHKMHLVYGNKNQNETILFEALNTIQNENFTIDYFFSKEENPSEKYHQGRINENYINNLLTKFTDTNLLHYICGPNELKKIIVKTLIENEVPIENIYTEDFDKNINPKDFENIDNQFVKINFQEKETQINVPKGKTILEQALDNQLEIPYSCQTGNCSFCKATVRSGKVKMIGLTKERTDLDANEVLLCCSYPLTDDVIININ